MSDWLFKTLSVGAALIGAANTLCLWQMNRRRLKVTGEVIGSGPLMSFTARIVNLSHREARIERVVLAVSHDERRPKTWRTVADPIRFEGCEGVPHVMPPRSRIIAHFTGNSEGLLEAGMAKRWRVVVE